MPNEPEFDWSQAASLLGDDPQQVPEDMAAIVLELVEGSKERFQELKQKKEETDAVAIAALAHQLRGSLLNFGFTAVGTILLQIEKHTYAKGEYAGLVDKAIVVFDASTKVLTSRYPTIRFP
jgi:HPt (histidine-containing phosphotransfer) domain-containing protein